MTERKYRPLRTYANLATIALVLYVILSFAEIISFAAIIPQIIVYLMTVILFVKWILEASRNLQALGSTGQEFSPQWSISWFFIPLANFVQPCRVMDEIWKGSYPHLTEGTLTAWRKTPTSPLIILWSVAWIPYLITHIPIYQRALQLIDPLPSEIIYIIGWIYLTSLVITPLITIILIRRITSNQDQKYSTHFEQIQESQGSDPSDIGIINPLTTPPEQVITCLRCKGGAAIIAITDQQILIAGENGGLEFSKPLSDITSVTRDGEELIIKDNDKNENRYEMGTWEDAQQLVSDIYNQKQKAIVKEETLDPQASQTMQ